MVNSYEAEMRRAHQLDMQESKHMRRPDTSILFQNHQYFFNWVFNPAPEISPQEIESEIETRLSLFGLPRYLIEAAKEGIIYLNREGHYSLLEGDQLDFARQLEKEYAIKIYYVFYEDTRRNSDSGYRYFFIDNDKKNWEFDHVDLMIHDPMCFKVRLNQGKPSPYAEPLGSMEKHIGLYWKEN